MSDVRQEVVAQPNIRESKMTARGPFAIVAIAFHIVLLPLPALAQTDVVPSAITPVEPSNPFISRQTATVAGLVLGAALLGDRSVREQAQEHRGSTSNSLA